MYNGGAPPQGEEGEEGEEMEEMDDEE